MRELDRIASESTPERCAIVGAGRLGHALAAALREAGIDVEGPLGRGASPDAPVVLLTRAGRRDPRGGAGDRWRGRARALLRRDDPRRPRRPRRLQPPPADDGAGGRQGAVRGRRVRHRREQRGGVADRGVARPGARHDPGRGRRRRPRRLPRRRLDRRELPGRPRGAGRAARGDGRRRRASCSSHSPAPPWRTGPPTARSTPSPAPSPAATKPRSRASGRPIEERAPDLLDTFDALVAASRVLAAT